MRKKTVPEEKFNRFLVGVSIVPSLDAAVAGRADNVDRKKATVSTANARPQSSNGGGTKDHRICDPTTTRGGREGAGDSEVG